MNEYLTEAFVLDNREVGDGDMLVTLYTQKLGKVKARATSIRKITSKLAGHFEPLTFVLARFVEKKGLRLVDGLSTHKTKNHEALRIAQLINAIAAEQQPDPVTWHFIKNVLMSQKKEHLQNHRMMLKAFGIEAPSEKCQICKNNPYSHFSVPDSLFVCARCGNDLKLGANEVLLVESHVSG